MTYVSDMEKEEGYLDMALVNDEITFEQWSKRIKELHRDFAEMAREQAREAYDAALNAFEYDEGIY